MTTRRRTAPPAEKRKWTNNLPYGPARRPPWNDSERSKKLRTRERYIGFGKLVSIIGTIALAAVDSRTHVNNLEISMAAMEAKFQQQIISLQADVNRQSSYWGTPPPRNVGQ